MDYFQPTFAAWITGPSSMFQNEPFPFTDNGPCISELAQSSHPETMNAGMGDGSVRPLSCYLSGTIWWRVYAQWRRSGSVVGLLTDLARRLRLCSGRLAWVPVLAMLFAPGLRRPPHGRHLGTGDLPRGAVGLGDHRFINADGSVAQGNVEDGLYHIAKVPVGPATIAVFAHPSPIPPRCSTRYGPRPPSARSSYPFPSAYQNADQSGLTYTVVRGKQTHDVPLVP